MSEEVKVNTKKLYALAQTALRNAHQQEFQDLLAAEYAKVGAEYRPRLTKEQRAERDHNIAVIKARQKLMASEAELAALLGQDALVAELTGTAEAEVIPGPGTTDRDDRIPYGGVHPVDPEQLERFEDAISEG